MQDKKITPSFHSNSRSNQTCKDTSSQVEPRSSQNCETSSSHAGSPAKQDCEKQPGTARNPQRIIFLILAACVVFLACYLFTQRSFFSERAQMKEDLNRLSEETYDSVLLSMHSAKSFREEDFAYYLALDTIITSHAITNTTELSRYLDCILESGNNVSLIYLCLDPALLWKSVGKNDKNWQDCLTRGLYTCIESHPGISFNILLPYPYIDYWRNLETGELDTLLTVYHTLVNELSAFPNVVTFFPGFEEWLMMAPGNYEESVFDINQDIGFTVFATTFCGDGRYQITPDNEDIFWNALRSIIEREKSTPTHYPDLSDWCLVLFGDSVLANYTGSTSIPGYAASLSGASVYNYAIGGTSAARRGEGKDLPDIFGRFVDDNIIVSEQGNIFAPNGTALDELEGKKLCFVFNYGINDYYSGVPVENPDDPSDIAAYTGSLRSCIRALQIILPDAYYIIMTPTHVQLFGQGTEPMSEKGSEFLVYINAAEELSSEMGLYFLDHYRDFIITERNADDYLSDGTHPNERGRYTIAASLIKFIGEIAP